MDRASLLDAYGNPVRMTGANWFGFNSGNGNVYGLDRRTLNAHVADMAAKGINVLRIPITVALTLQWKQGTGNLGAFNNLVAAAKTYGVKIILDMHAADTGGDTHTRPVWYSPSNPIGNYHEAWEWLATTYKNDDTIIAFDLKNEPHGWANRAAPGYGQPDLNEYAFWGDSTDVDTADPRNWPAAAKKVAQKIHAINPNVLIVVEGVERVDDQFFWWGGNLNGVLQFPIDLGKFQNKLVYSAHLYGPAVVDQPWYHTDVTNLASPVDLSKAALYAKKWNVMFGFIHEGGISHLFFGEWGGITRASDGNGVAGNRSATDISRNILWMGAFRDYLIETNSSHTFWAYNPNSDDTGGLVGNDWTTWDSIKYTQILKPALWQTAAGLFISLDHRTSMPGGTNVAAVYGTKPDLDKGDPAGGVGVPGSGSSSSSSSSSGGSSTAGDNPLNLLTTGSSLTAGVGDFVAYAFNPLNTITFADGVANVDFMAVSTASWQVQLTHPIAVTMGAHYTACIDAIAEKARQITIDFDNGTAPTYLSLTGASANPLLGTTWKTHKLSFIAKVTAPAARLSLNLGMIGAPVNLKLDNIGVYAGDVCPSQP